MERFGRLSYIAVLLLALAAACGPREQAAETGVIVKVTNVAVYTVTPAAFEYYITLPVVVEPYRQVNLGLVGGGKVTALHVDKGDLVKKGMTLLETDTVMLEASVALAESNLEYQRKEFDRAEKLLRDGSITDAVFDGAKLALAQAESNYTMANKQLDNATLIAPFDGVVTVRNCEIGDILAPGSPAFRIIDMSRVRVQTGIPEKYISDFAVGNNFTIMFDAIQQEKFSGTVSYIAPEANPAVRTFQAEMIVKNDQGNIRAGIMGNTRLLRGRIDNAIAVPLDAIIEGQAGRSVFIARDDNTAEQRLIEIGEMSDRTVQVVNGLAPGDKVIAKGQYDLVTGERITITGEYVADSPEGSKQ